MRESSRDDRLGAAARDDICCDMDDKVSAGGAGSRTCCRRRSRAESPTAARDLDCFRGSAAINRAVITVSHGKKVSLRGLSGLDADDAVSAAVLLAAAAAAAPRT